MRLNHPVTNIERHLKKEEHNVSKTDAKFVAIQDFQALFESVPSLCLVLDPNLIIVAVSDAYANATMTKRKEIVGRGIFEVFPDNPDDPAADGVSNLKASLLRVLQNREADAMAVQKYDIRKPEAEGGGFEVRYWSPLNSPVLNKDGQLTYIIHRVEDVTEFVQLKQKGIEQSKLTEELRERGVQMEAEIYTRAREVAEANIRLKNTEQTLRQHLAERKQVEEILQKNQANLRAILDNSPYLTWLKDAEGHYIKINKVFADYIKLGDATQAEGKTDLDLNPKELAEKYRADDAEVIASRKRKHVEEQAFDGKEIHWIETFKTPVIDEQGKVLGTVGFAQDITERKQIETELRISSVAFDTQEAMVITDPNGVILRVNKAFTESSGYSAEESVGRKPSILKSGHHDADFYRAMWEAIQQNGAWQGEIWDRRKNGEVYPKWLTISAVKDAAGVVTHYVGSHFDITERKRAEEQIKSLAFYDHLTRLPNRRLLIERLSQALVSCGRSGRNGALLFIDLDNFKSLNDTLGHNIGDLLLQQVAQRLDLCVREGDTVARLGGDEFVVLLEDLSKVSLEAAAQAEGIGEKILVALNQPYYLGTHEHHNTPSIGITLFNEKQQVSEELFKQADLAMYQAKKAGRNTLRFFDPQMQESINARSSIEGELRKAFENHEFHLYYQVQVDRLRRPTGAEALIRWIQPERGTVSPAQFIPLAEESGLILPIGQWVLETACVQLKAWQQHEATRNLILSINVSARQFNQANFVDEVQAAVQRHGINPQLLKLELTESMLLEKIEEIIATMNALKAIGVRISLDDFGTGYSSLQYLKRLPLTQLKIDQSFVRDLGIDNCDKAIAQTIIAMAQNLKLDVIAEGVETDEQRKFLENAGCHHYQGYLFGKPTPIEQFEAQIKQLSLLDDRFAATNLQAIMTEAESIFDSQAANSRKLEAEIRVS